MIEEFSGQFITLKNFCLEKDLFEDDCIALIALSGGADSVYLLHFLLWLQQRKIYQNFNIVAAHVNHQIRQEANNDQHFVESLCDYYQITLYTKKVDVPALAVQRKKGIEEAGRFARYSFFSEIKEKLISEKNSKVMIVLGHHQDDLAESVAINIGRGSGISGLSSLKAKEQDFRRPLLYMTKEQIYSLLKEKQWQWIEDESNQSDDYLRNRIRNELLPKWTDVIGYDIKPILARLAMNLESDEEAFQFMVEKAFQECKTENGELLLKRIQNLPLSLLKAVLDFWLKNLGYPEKVITAIQFEQIKHIIHGEHGNKRVQIGDGLEMKRQKNRIILLRNQER